eukprot:COSAG02_NODE_60_length_43475_cov_59.494582_19_plen_845_part_00
MFGSGLCGEAWQWFVRESGSVSSQRAALHHQGWGCQDTSFSGGTTTAELEAACPFSCGVCSGEFRLGCAWNWTFTFARCCDTGVGPTGDDSCWFGTTQFDLCCTDLTPAEAPAFCADDPLFVVAEALPPVAERSFAVDEVVGTWSWGGLVGRSSSIPEATLARLRGAPGVTLLAQTTVSSLPSFSGGPPGDLVHHAFAAVACGDGQYPFNRLDPASTMCCVEGACGPGWFASNSAVATSGCERCAPGRFSASADGATDCTDCVPGRFSEAEGSPACTHCAVGRYAPTYRSTGCTNCAAGSEPNTLSTSCTQCDPGRYSAASTACADCAAGSVTDTLSESAATKCTTCDAGQFSTVSTEACVDCAVGQHAPTEGNSGCINCPAGTSTRLSGSVDFSDCIACVPGQFAATGGSPCVNCAAGYYTSTRWSTDCIACVPGKFVGSEGSDKQSDCADCAVAGSVPDTLDHPGATACAPCPAGKYQLDTFHVFDSLGPTCTPHDATTRHPRYADVETHMCGNCIDCDAGLFSTAVGSTNSSDCTTCTPGRFSTTAGSSDCTDCTVADVLENDVEYACCVAEVSACLESEDGLRLDVEVPPHSGSVQACIDEPEEVDLTLDANGLAWSVVGLRERLGLTPTTTGVSSTAIAFDQLLSASPLCVNLGCGESCFVVSTGPRSGTGQTYTFATSSDDEAKEWATDIEQAIASRERDTCRGAYHATTRALAKRSIESVKVTGDLQTGITMDMSPFDKVAEYQNAADANGCSSNALCCNVMLCNSDKLSCSVTSWLTIGLGTGVACLVAATAAMFHFKKGPFAKRQSAAALEILLLPDPELQPRVDVNPASLSSGG